MDLPVLIDWKGDSYDLIFVIVNQLTKMVYYELVKVTINALDFAEVIINVVVRHHGLSESIVTNRGLLFTSKFWLLLYYFLGIKQRLFTAFYSQTDGRTEKQNSTIEAYLQAFVNFKQNNWVQLFPIAEFAYNNAKNVSTNYMLFELNCGYHLCVSYKEEEILDPRSKSKTAGELSSKLQELIIVCQQNFYHAQELQKRVHNKGVKSQSYAPGNKVWLSSKHLKTKWNCKLEAKFLRLFQMLYPVGKQVYKFKLSKK